MPNETSMRILLLSLLAILSATAPAHCQSLALEPVAEGLTAPLHLEQPDDGSARKFIVQQDGVVKVLDRNNRIADEPFLDLRPRMRKLEQDFEERGLLGFALHPDFARNGRVYVSYAAPLRQGAPQSWNYTRRISELSTAPGDLSTVVPESERVLLELDWPSRKHNGGALAFGPDGLLYIGLGDGGVSHGVGEKVRWEAFDVPAAALSWDHLAQDTQSLFGKILRLDVDHGFPGYALPPDNPFVSGSQATLGKPEVWASGFRNPFRLAFDRTDGAAYVTAVAETLWESAYRVTGPGNFGWPLLEGTHCVDRLNPRQPPKDCERTDAAGQPLQLPVVEYSNMQASHPDTKLGIEGAGTAITGARMYRGKEIEQLRGKLLVSDWSASFKEPSGQLFVASPNPNPGQLWGLDQLLRIDARIVSLAEDADGEIYVLTNETLGPYGTAGKVWRLVEKR